MGARSNGMSHSQGELALLNNNAIKVRLDQWQMLITQPLWTPPRSIGRRAAGWGQLAGDSLDSLAEFQSPAQILRQYPDGVRQLAGGGDFGTIPGQPTDDSEMALMLARSLAEHERFDVDAIRKAYICWLDTNPFSPP